jgi:PDZ domain/Aspartyl protease
MKLSPPTTRRHPRLAASRSLLLLLALALCPRPAGAEDNIEPKAVTVPFELLKTQHMTVQIKINGKGPYRLIFDTGAPVTLINNKVAKDAGVFPKDFKRPPFAFFGSMGQFTMQSLEVGDLKIEKVKTMVMDHPTVAAISSALGPIEGIVGFNFFAKYRMTLDYQAKTMTFVPTQFQPQDMMENLMKMVMAGQSKDSKKILAPAGLLGLKVHKDKDDMNPGVTVKAVFPDSPAAQASFKEGDRLLTLDGCWTDSVVDCYSATARLAPGTPVRAVVLRDGKEKELQVELRPGL